ncbi:hypothetical protein HK100_006935 [Physocladia obscura]|uniref:Uncharacterized protein n=1 Tax=Physocladia obscura TaxID=109957 RepID=A0AAD5XBF4_9FUNG|nr:hypothetical protein HK100_006935 [Physocladia obscura]
MEEFEPDEKAELEQLAGSEFERRRMRPILSVFDMRRLAGTNRQIRAIIRSATAGEKYLWRDCVSLAFTLQLSLYIDGFDVLYVGCGTTDTTVSATGVTATMPYATVFVAHVKPEQRLLAHSAWHIFPSGRIFPAANTPTVTRYSAPASENPTCTLFTHPILDFSPGIHPVPVSPDHRNSCPICCNHQVLRYGLVTSQEAAQSLERFFNLSLSSEQLTTEVIPETTNVFNPWQ